MPSATKVLKKTIAGMYQPYRLHRELFTEKFKRNWLHPDFLEIHKAVEKATNGTAAVTKPKELSPKLKVEIPHVYSFNVFTQEFVSQFDEEIKNFYVTSEQKNIPIRRPNSMNNYGVIVNEIGLKPLITSFQQEYLWPVACKLFPRQGSQFDDHHSFIVRYRSDEDLGLDMHTDDSDVTFNVCLGEDFSGATLSFCGMFGAEDHRKFLHTYHHDVGRAVLHLGSHRHGADDIQSGSRSNLIVWNHNWKWRSSRDYTEMMTAAKYKKEGGPPDDICLSFTHDKDYGAYKEYPEHVKRDPELMRPWCPPKGFEYDGFNEAMKKFRKKQR